ncbi:hypothetical protein ANO11243_061820 [Dothideomycetidae sp. 11243]|nr:hypothetical protein ANO11243_061820 [fungal sp. No.11243]
MGLQDRALPVDSDNEPINSLPVVKDSGQPNAVIWECPELERTIDYRSTWYHLNGVPDFLICTKCYGHHLAGSQISKQFAPTERDSGACRFNVPRLTKSLVPEARRTNNLEPVRAFMLRRLSVPDCKGQASVGHEDNIKWFATAGSQSTGFVACEACYEDHVLANSFASHFRPSDPGQQVGEFWACDFCIPVIKRAYWKLSKSRNGWDEWQSLISKRMSLPQCNGQEVDAASCEWYKLRGTADGMVFCSTCFHDKVMYTPFAGAFESEPVNVPQRTSQLVGAILGNREQEVVAANWNCDMGSIASICCAWDTAMLLREFGVFQRAASKIIANPTCSADGIEGKTIRWHTLAGGCHNFDICDGCYAGIIEPLGLGQFFQPVGAVRTASVTLVCDFNPATRRFVPYLMYLNRALDTGVWQHFSQYVRKWAGIPPCQGRKLLENECWYGFGDMLACPECFLTFAEGTRLGRTAPVKNVRMPQNRMCSLYSKRMRTKWLEACEKNDPTDLIAFSRHRMEIYQGTVLRIDYMRSMQLLEVQKANHDGLMSTMYGAIENIAIRGGTGAVDGYWHGRHLTRFGATADALRAQSHAGMSQALNPGIAMQIMQLERQWAEVE